MNARKFDDLPVGLLNSMRLTLPAGLAVLLVSVGSSPAGSVVAPRCPTQFCRTTLVQPASLFGDDERRTEAQYAREHNLSLKQVQDRYAASGAISCTGFGESRARRPVLYASGQLTVRRDIITTTAHTIIDKSARLMGKLENCVFETRIGGRKVSARLTSDYIAGFKDDRDSYFAGFDWAVIRLEKELPIEPYGVVDDLQPLFSWLDVANVTKIANFNFDNWGTQRTRTKSLADCAIKPETVAWSTGVRGLRTDCDIAPGNSGGAVLSEASGRPMLIGIMVGTTATSFTTRKPFDLLHDYNIGALVEGEFLQAIRDMSSTMPVGEMQTALNGLGFDAGPADGSAGPRTRAAIRAFEKDRGMAETGTVTLALSMALRKAVSEKAGEQSAGKPFDAAADAFIGELYDWRAVSATRRAADLPEWLDDAALGADIAGPQSAWASTRLRGCRNVLACLDAYGAPAQALRAAYALEKSGLIGTYVNSFTEYGQVDLVSVGYPYNTGGLVEYALVNGNPEAVAMRAGDVLKVPIDDPGYVRLREEQPQAAIQFAPRFEAYRLMPDGGQRFVFSYPVTDGCQLCDAIGQVLIANDFAPDGKYMGLSVLAYADADEELARQVRRSFDADDLMDDIALVQRRLNGLGYEAGPVDGVSGRRTIAAINQFQSEHGLPESGRLDSETAALLATDGSMRHLQRLETLLMRDAPGADTFGLGLLSRFRQLPGNDQLQFAALANNMAGQLRRAGRFDEALEQLRQAEAAVNLVPSARFDLYEAILLNSAAVHIDRGHPASAEETLRRATAVLRSRAPDFPIPDLNAETRPDLALVENRRKATEGLAALSAYLTARAAASTPGTVRLTPMPVTDGAGAHLFIFQSIDTPAISPGRT